MDGNRRCIHGGRNSGLLVWDRRLWHVLRHIGNRRRHADHGDRWRGSKGCLGSILGAELGVVFVPFVVIEEAARRLRNFGEEALRLLLALAGLEAAKVADALVCRVGDDVWVGFEPPDA